MSTEQPRVEHTLKDACLVALTEISGTLTYQLPEEQREPIIALIKAAVGMTVEVMEDHFQISYIDDHGMTPYVEGGPQPVSDTRVVQVTDLAKAYWVEINT